MQTDKHILPGREADSSELLMAQDRELGTKQWKQMIYTIAKVIYTIAKLCLVQRDYCKGA